jgi:hypothetical protein
MALFDGYDPQDFADRGGLLGRLLSLRPDLAQDQQEYPGQVQLTTAPQAPAPTPSLWPPPTHLPNTSDNINLTPECAAVWRVCHENCLGSRVGFDTFGPYRRCVRECMNANGCFDF